MCYRLSLRDLNNLGFCTFNARCIELSLRPVHDNGLRIIPRMNVAIHVITEIDDAISWKEKSHQMPMHVTLHVTTDMIGSHARTFPG